MNGGTAHHGQVGLNQKKPGKEWNNLEVNQSGTEEKKLMLIEEPVLLQRYVKESR